MDCWNVALFGAPFEVRWRSADGRSISNGTACYRFISYACHEKKDSDALALALPLNIERGLIPFGNPFGLLIETPGGDGPGINFGGTALADPDAAWPIIQELTVALAQNTCLNPTSYEALLYRNIADGRLPVKHGPGVPDSAPKPDPKALADLLRSKAERDFQTRFAVSHASICRVTFGNGLVLYVKAVAPCPIPPEALTFFGQAALQESLAKLGVRARETDATLAHTRAQLNRARDAAGLTLKQALEDWMRLDVPGKSAATQAKIKQAVSLYLTNPDLRSLAKIAEQFRVSRTTVSKWFKRFSATTGLPVVRHARHESAREQGRAAAQDKRRQAEGSDEEDNPEATL